MAQGIEIKVTSGEVEERLRKLSDRSGDAKIYKRIFRRALVHIRKGVQAKIREKTNPHRKGVKRWTRKGYYYPPPLTRDVKVALYKKTPGGSVSLLNPRRTPNRAYILRILNTGSGKRSTAKGMNRGLVSPLGFFTEAVNARIEGAKDMLGKSIIDELNKLQ